MLVDVAKVLTALGSFPVGGRGARHACWAVSPAGPDRRGRAGRGRPGLSASPSMWPRTPTTGRGRPARSSRPTSPPIRPGTRCTRSRRRLRDRARARRRRLGDADRRRHRCVVLVAVVASRASTWRALPHRRYRRCGPGPRAVGGDRRGCPDRLRPPPYLRREGPRRSRCSRKDSPDGRSNRRPPPPPRRGRAARERPCRALPRAARTARAPRSARAR